MNKSDIRILIVDDEEDILDFVGYNLRKEGYQVIEATNGFDAIDLAARHHPELIILDIMMPEMDGMELLQNILAKDGGAMVIFLTGYPSLDTAINALRSGAYDYLVKPVNLDELKLRIERGLERKEHLKSLFLVKGLNWALLLSIPLWLLLGIILAKLLR